MDTTNKSPWEKSAQDIVVVSLSPSKSARFFQSYTRQPKILEHFCEWRDMLFLCIIPTPPARKKTQRTKHEVFKLNSVAKCTCNLQSRYCQIHCSWMATWTCYSPEWFGWPPVFVRRGKNFKWNLPRKKSVPCATLRCRSARRTEKMTLLPQQNV